MAKIILTGSAGFIGQHLSKRLKEMGHTLWEMDKKFYKSTSDVYNTKNLHEWKADMIVHLGANCSSQISLKNPELDFVDNVIGTFNICEVARLSGGIPIIFNSTMKVYPGEDGIIPPYGISKQIGEMYLKTYNKLYNVPYVINRPSSVYGPLQDGSDDGGWVTWFIKAALTGQKINLYGDGTQSRDILYIDDCIDMLVDQVTNFEKYKNQDFDWGGGIENELSLNELLDILDYHNVEYKPKLQGDVQRFIVDNTKANSFNNWKPKVSCRQGVEKTIKYFKENL